MRLEIRRSIFGDTFCAGDLFIDGKWFCNTLEDTDRRLEKTGKDSKQYGKTAIPRGEYAVSVTWSNRFSKYMIQIMNVPYFEGIRIHGGRSPEDSRGCPLVRVLNEDNTLRDSRITSNALFKKVDDAIREGEKVTIEIV